LVSDPLRRVNLVLHFHNYGDVFQGD
jgi:hypothetical protein